METKYKRVVLKISGESLSSNNGLIFDSSKLKELAKIVEKIQNIGIKVAIVIGAGNIFRGRIAEELGIEKEDGDYIGMVGTIINCKAFSSVLANLNIKNVVFSSLHVDKVAQVYNKVEAKKHYENGEVVLFAGGTGFPGFTTDTCATRRAIDIEAEAILMGKHGIDGVYSSDPNRDSEAKFLKDLTYQEVLDRNLKVMDISAIKELMPYDIDVKVFSMATTSNFVDVCLGKDIGTTICKGDH